MKDILFDNWHQWVVCFSAGCKSFGWGIARIFSCILLGIASLIRAGWRAVVHFVGINPSTSIIVALVVFSIIAVIGFVSNKVRYSSIEHQRDSLSYELSKYQFPCGVTDGTSDDNHDTIVYGR